MPELLSVVLVILGLVAINALFVAAEFAIIGAPRAAIAARAESGDRIASRIAATLDDPNRLDRYVATAQLGITFASLGLGMYGEHELALFFEDWLAAAGLDRMGTLIAAHGLAAPLAIAAITYLHIVFGEMIPKALALNHGMRVALWVTPPMFFVGRLLSPLVRALNHVANLLLRLASVERGRMREHYLDSEEIESLARESALGGLLSEETGRIFREIADFNRITAEQAMMPRVRAVGIPLGATDAELREILRRDRHTRYPVYDGSLDQIVGTVHIKDLIRLLRRGTGIDRSVIHATAYLPQTATLDDVLIAMERARNQLIVVMDEHGGTAGILTIEDICAEAVGDIEEGAEDLPDVLPVGRDRFQVLGMVRLDRLGSIIGLPLEHPEVDSVSGLILSELGRPPVLGDQVRWHGLCFSVARLHGRGVRQAMVRLEPPHAPEAQDR